MTTAGAQESPPAQTAPPGQLPSGGEPDKQYLYGKYLEGVNPNMEAHADRVKWQNQLQRQVAFKALDEPDLEDDPMHINAPKTYNYYGDPNKPPSKPRNGWMKALLVGGAIAGTGGLGLGTGLAWGTFGPAISNVINNLGNLGQSPSSVHPQPSDTDTRIVPQIRFGPDIGEPDAQ